MKTKFLRFLSLIMTVCVLTAVTALVSCKADTEKTDAPKTTATATTPKTDAPKTTATAATPTTDEAVISIEVEVTNDKGEKQTYPITTKATTLRAALEEIDLIKGDESQYGLYVKEVAGVVADYDKDGAYWAFYKDGEYLMTGVDTTMISDGDHYEIVYTK